MNKEEKYTKEMKKQDLWYDERGNVIHIKYSDGFEEWYEYDEKGNIIHYKNSYGSEEWYEYDEKGNRIYGKYSDGYEEWYDEEGNVIKQTYGTSNIKLVKQSQEEDPFTEFYPPPDTKEMKKQDVKNGMMNKGI